MKIYVSNLGHGVQAKDLEKIFVPYGVVSSINVVVDKVTNRSRGFAFVEMPDQEASEKAMRELNGKMIDGRSLRMNEAMERR
jgi:RNA recognition motif-containing protein